MPFDFDQDKIIAFMQMHQNLAPVVIFLLAMGETIIVLSVFIPSSLLLFALGGLMAASGIPLLPSLIAGGIGASIGFGFSYLVGALCKERILLIWPLRNHPETVLKTRALSAKWGLWAVLFGHFSGPVRPVIPLLAGMAHMPPHQFFMANIPGAFAWITVFFAPSYLLVSSEAFQRLYEKAQILIQ